MRKDLRPYFIKKIYVSFRSWYTQFYISPKCDFLGAYPTFMKPWFTYISGPNIRIGKCVTIISETEARVRIGVWGHELDQGKIEIGDYVLISPACRISASDEIRIGNNVMMANGVYITDSDWHGIYDRVARPKEAHPVIIGDNVWLGDHATVLKGVTIGENSIIAANSVITRDVPANVVMAGNPAQIVKELDEEKGFRTRADFFKDPESLNVWIDKIDYMVLKDNGFFNWMRALVWPTRND